MRPYQTSIVKPLWKVFNLYFSTLVSDDLTVVSKIIASTGLGGRGEIGTN